MQRKLELICSFICESDQTKNANGLPETLCSLEEDLRCLSKSIYDKLFSQLKQKLKNWNSFYIIASYCVCRRVQRLKHGIGKMLRMFQNDETNGIKSFLETFVEEPMISVLSRFF